MASRSCTRKCASGLLEPQNVQEVVVAGALEARERVKHVALSIQHIDRRACADLKTSFGRFKCSLARRQRLRQCLDADDVGFYAEVRIACRTLRLAGNPLQLLPGGAMQMDSLANTR